jgi:ATP-dependent helicase/nuclease subunit B
MSQTIVFLGWDKPWTDLFAGWLESEPDRLRRCLVVVPTRESGRRLRERLVSKTARNGSGAILGPRMATPDDFFRPDQTMPDAIRWAGWLSALRETRDQEVASLFPSGVANRDDAWRLAVIRQIEQARELLASGNADFAAVAASLSGDHDRWQELARLEQGVVSLWKQWGWADPVRAKRARALNPLCPQGVDEIILAGVADPTALAVESWRGLAERKIPITVLVGAPANLKPAFDDWGRPKPEFWSDRRQHTTPEPTRSLVAADAVALADAVVRSCMDRSNADVAVGVCDATFAPAIARRFQEAGWPTFDPEGVPLAKDGWPELLEALAGALDSPNDHAAIARAARHPAVWAQWLEGYSAKATFAALDKWEVKNAISNPAITIERLCASDNEAEKAAGALLAKVHGFVKAASAGGPNTIETTLRAWLQAGPPEAASHALAEMDSWPQLPGTDFGLSLRLQWLASSLASVARSSDASEAVLALQGWLELSFDPAAHLILAGLHEGCVPEAPPSDPLITESVREKLGLRNRQSRLARETFLYTAMVEGRRAGGSVTVLTAQVNAQGDPCQPSRVLLQARPEILPARVLKFVKEKPDVPLQHTPPWSRGVWKLRPPPNASPNKEWKHVSPSALRAYLACPTRFYFARVLGWEKFVPFDAELNAGGFGDLIHSVLRRWGGDTEARELADAGKLKACWLDLLKKEADEQFGSSVPPLIRLQLMSAEERLVELSEKQAEQRRQGWRVVEVEKQLDGVLTLAGLPVHMRVDRIDRHEDGPVRVIDYKTGKTSEDPRKTHLRAWSEERCLAPLGPLWVVKGKSKDKSYGWTDLQLPLYAEAVRKHLGLAALPEAYYALMPEAVGDTQFMPFEGMDEATENALSWAEEAARRIVAGVFWPPAPEVKYDDLAALAPEGLERALGGEWAKFLAGNPQDNEKGANP